MPTIIILGCIIGLLFSYKFFVLPVLSPLSKIPNAHITTPFSNAWILWQRYRSTENRAIHDSHRRLGPIVRLGPTEISVNSLEGLRTIYGDNLDKHEWYCGAFENYGMPNMFSMVHRKPHMQRKRMLANLYSKSTLQCSPDIRRISQVIVMDRLLPILETAAKSHAPFDAFEHSLATSMDFITAYLFGLRDSSNFLQDVETRKKWLAIHHSTKGYGFWPLEFPRFFKWLERLGIQLVDPKVFSASDEVKELCLQMLKNVEAFPREDTKFTKPVVYEQLSGQLRASLNPDYTENGTSSLHLRVASELMDHMFAGTETSGWTLTYIMHELSQRPHLQSSLREELLSLSPPIYHPPSFPVNADDTKSTSPSNLATSRAIDVLPLLDAIVLETLRLHPAVPGPQPRVTPPSRISLCGYSNIPTGIRVSAQAYSLHRNSEVFPEPELWRPERWMGSKEQRDEMMRWFWAFGSGGHMCIGNHFAMIELKLFVAAIYTNYTTKIMDDDGIEQQDAYSAGPKSNKLILQLERA